MTAAPRGDGSWPHSNTSNGTVSDFIYNQSSVPGKTVTEALNALAAGPSGGPTIFACGSLLNDGDLGPQLSGAFNFSNPQNPTANAMTVAFANPDNLPGSQLIGTLQPQIAGGVVTDWLMSIFGADAPPGSQNLVAFEWAGPTTGVAFYLTVIKSPNP